MSDYALELQGVAKHFPPNVVALRDAWLQVYPGEVHCLVGANGAGKSTLLKIVAGAHRADIGSLYVGGQLLSPRSPSDATAAGISMVYQELDLVPELSVEQNLFLGRAPQRLGVLARRERRERTHAALQRVCASFSSDSRVGALSVANKQMVVIARALTMEARVVVMDEPSAALNETELERVFEIIRQITAEGVAVVYVSHRLSEINAIGDRVTVMRNGTTVDTFAVADTDEDSLLTSIVGENTEILEQNLRNENTVRSESALHIHRLDGPQGLTIRDLTVCRGEIIGLSGLSGAGRTTLLKALFGSVQFDGDVTLFGDSYQPSDIQEAIQRGVGLVPENRKTEGLVVNAPIYRNAQLAALRRRTFISQGTLERDSQDTLAELSTKYESASQSVARLSGGNQQKVVLAKWIIDGSQLLLLDEPSRGLDVGAKAELYRLAKSIAARGDAVLVASSEFEELYVNCDRIWVIHEGRNVACFNPLEAESQLIQHTAITGHIT